MDFHMQLNDNKAGLEGLNKDRINAIIKEASAGSLYTRHQEKRALRIQERIRQQNEALSKFTQDQIRQSELEMDRLATQLEDDRDLSRTIIHIDMDAFYAAVEMRDDPALRNVPMAVGGNSMLSTSNYIARRFGVRAAMAGYIGKKLCPQLVIVPTNFRKYKSVSDQIRKIFSEYDPNFLSMSLDEAYLDITDYLRSRKADSDLKRNHIRRRYSGKCECKLPRCEEAEDGTVCARETCQACGEERVIVQDEVSFGHSPEETTRELRFHVEQETGLTASAGISVNKLLAKVCTDINKPNGQYFLPPVCQNIMEFLEKLPIRKICGIGGVTEAMLKALGIETCKDLYEKRGLLALIYSPTNARFFLRVSLGLGSTLFDSGTDGDHERKSIGVERTFAATGEIGMLVEICQKLCQKAVEHMRKKDLKARTVVLKIKTVEFESRTRATTLDSYVCDYDPVYNAARKSLCEEIELTKPHKLCLRLLGVRLASFLHENDSSSVNLPKITRYMRVAENATAASTSSGKKTGETHFESGFSEAAAESSSSSVDNDDVSILKVENGAVASTSAVPSTDACVFPNDVTGNDDTTLDNKAHECASAVCPVCNSRLVKLTLDRFNHHLDQCLNRRAISNLIRRQDQELLLQSPSSRDDHQKRKRKGQRRKSNAKTIRISPSKETGKKIDEFFKPIRDRSI